MIVVRLFAASRRAIAALAGAAWATSIVAVMGLIGAGPTANLRAADASGPTPAGKAVAQDAAPGPRVRWTTSKVTGSPEPPPPYVAAEIFPKIKFRHPLCIKLSPDGNRWFVAQQEGKILSFANRQDADKQDLFLDTSTELKTFNDAAPGAEFEALYGLTFHPKFAENHYCYVCYVLHAKSPAGTKRAEAPSLPNGTRVSRFTVTQLDPPRADPASEQIVIDWRGGGHNGGDLAFGPDGYLYISSGDTGDATPPDGHNQGQDMTSLASSILRIDVDHPSEGRPYSIPADNPFVKTPAGARGEKWAYGLRNPWRMGFDRANGELWVGDVGWETWEMIDRIQKGGNYGWSIVEGPQPIHADGKMGPTPIVQPMLSLPHTQSVSLTGGYIYRGKRWKDLVGAYICGDWETRRAWAMKFDPKKPDGESLIWERELAKDTPRIVAFAEDKDGELLFLDYDQGGVFQLEPNPAGDNKTVFPRQLSETGLFASTPEHKVAPGVVPFSIQTEMWADRATAERFVAAPGDSQVIGFDEPQKIRGSMYSDQYEFPRDGVLVKTYSLEMKAGDPASRRRLETQLLHYDGRNWNGYSYAWNDQQTDAALVEAAGKDRTLHVVDPQAPGGFREQTWHYASRNECLICHNPLASYRLAFKELQLGPARITELEANGVLRKPLVGEIRSHGEDPKRARPMLVNPYDETAKIDERARSYLEANCSHCHQEGAGGLTTIELQYRFPLNKTATIDQRPMQGGFGLDDARIIAPGDPFRSVMFYRVCKTGRGRMPHLGSELVDAGGVQVLHDWIAQLSDSSRGGASGDHLPDLKAIAKQPDAERGKSVAGLLSSTGGALRTQYALDHERDIPAALREQIVAAATANSVGLEVRDLFEEYLPADKRAKRLGSLINPKTLLGVKGDAAHGKELFASYAGVVCKNCHKIDKLGGQVGPELTQVGKKYDRAAILEKLMFPSKKIDPKFANYILTTTNGEVFTGVMVEQPDKKVVVLRDAQDKPHSVPRDEVEHLAPQLRSLMPDQQLRDLTPQQAADLLEYLGSLK